MRQLIFSRKSDCLGCAVLLCLVCLFDLACFFLSSHLSFKNMYIHIMSFRVDRGGLVTPTRVVLQSPRSKQEERVPVSNTCSIAIAVT